VGLVPTGSIRAYTRALSTSDVVSATGTPTHHLPQPGALRLKISQEETLGWVLAYARGRKLLTEEARPIGKLAGTLATEAKSELDGVRGRAKKRLSRARQKGASAEELAAIDKEVAMERTAITEAECGVKHMPDANTE